MDWFVGVENFSGGSVETKEQHIIKHHNFSDNPEMKKYEGEWEAACDNYQYHAKKQDETKPKCKRCLAL